MKIDIISDVHLDVWMKLYTGKPFRIEEKYVKSPNVDVCVLAGDVGNGHGIFQTFVEFLRSQYSKVVYVQGNHDFYLIPSEQSDSPAAIRSEQRRKEWINERDPSLTTFNIQGVKFVCATLWSNFWGAPDLHGPICEKYLNDFRYIPELENSDRPSELMSQWYDRSRQFLLDHSDADVVVTHFAPTVDSIAARYVGNPLNPYFTNDDQELMNMMSPKIWIHGHTHTAFDYMINNTRVVCNPIGYPRENMNSLMITPKMVEI